MSQMVLPSDTDNPRFLYRVAQSPGFVIPRRLVRWALRLARSLVGRAIRILLRPIGVIIRFQFGKPVPPSKLVGRLIRASSSRLIGQQILEPMISSNIDFHGSNVVAERVREALSTLGKRDPKAASTLYIAALRALGTRSYEHSIEFGESCIASVNAPHAARTLAQCYERAGGIVRPLELLLTLKEAERPPATHRRLTLQAGLLDRGIVFGRPLTREWTPAPSRIMYYASQSLPHHTNGYGIRTHWLVRNLKEKGWDISVFSRFGYPDDRNDFVGATTVGSAQIDGIPYSFVPRKVGFSMMDIESYQEASVSTLVTQSGEYRPSLIHCASNYTCGLAGTETAKRLGIPCIYEVRGLWHLTRASKQREYADSDHFRLSEKLEAQAAKSADHVFAITDAVKELLMEYGVPESKMTVLPNAVDTSQFVVSDRDPELEQRWRLGGKVVIGYIGSFNDYEGLDYLLEAAAMLHKVVGDEFRILLVGDGTNRGELTSLASRLGIADIVSFTGSQPHERIQAFYSLMDIMVFPRKGHTVCEVVSPLKPFEAMATGKAVVASDVRALAEIVRHNETGLLHRKDDVDSLREQLEAYLSQPNLRARLARQGQDWVTQHRSWSAISDKVGAVYRELIGTCSQ